VRLDRRCRDRHRLASLRSKRGLVAGGGGLLLALTGDPISAQDALRYGLINAVTPTGGALDPALALAARITPNGPLALAATRETVLYATDWTLDEGWDEQEKIFAPVFTSDDAKEGARAFADKCRPIWTGR
jgi:enoyl-CoA hydratase